MSSPPPSTTARPGARVPVLAGVFIAVLDFFVVNVAIPSIRADLDAGAAAVQWVVAGYGLSYGVGLITGGRLGDRSGHRRVYLVGLALFAATSLVCGLAPTAGTLVVARIAQGAAAAVMVPQVLAILNSVYSGEERMRAINAYGVSMVLAAVFGQLLGGLVIQLDLAGLGWRICFLVNLPVVAATMIAVRRLVPDVRARGTARLDLRGAALATLALTAVILPLIEGREHGWPRWTWAGLASSVVLLVLFCVHQQHVGRSGRDPLVDLGLFRSRTFAVGLAAQLVFWMGQASFLLVFALYLQLGRGLGPLAAGAAYLPLGAGYLVSSLSARWVARRLGHQAIAAGTLAMAAGELLTRYLVTRIGAEDTLLLIAPALCLQGLGMGVAINTLASTILARVGPGLSGTAAGVLTTAQQLGNAFGVAIIGTVFYGGLMAGESYARAFQLSLVFLLAVAVTVAVLVQLLPRRQPVREEVAVRA